MGYEANPSAPSRAGSRSLGRLRESEALRAALRVFTVSRALVLVVAIFAALNFGPASGGLSARNAATFDDPALTHSLGGAGDVLLAPLARWDAVWYLEIAASGYGGEQHRAAFLPLYPLLVRAVGELGGGSPGALLIASYLVALAAFLGALVLLHRLVTLELGRPLAAPTLLLLAFFPASLYFGAPYSESVFLLASVGAFYAARTGHWAWAGVAAAGAAATRSAGVLLVVPLLVLYLWGPRADRQGPGRHRLRLDAAWLLLAPLGLAAYALYLQLAHGDGLAFLDVQHAWYRHFAGPLGGIWDGIVAAFDGARQLLSGSREHVYFDRAGGDPYRVASMNLMLFGFLVLALWAAVGTLRRLPRAYGVYVAVALLLPLSFPVGPQPLMSLPRFLAVLFPVFMWLALVCEERRITDRVVGASALGLGLFTAQFATWHFIA
jgi:mannosyltransferase PIG-V